MSNTQFQPKLLAGAHVDYQVKVQPIGNFPSELSSVLLTGAFPLSPSPGSSEVEGLKILNYQQRYLCFCWFFQAGRRDERGRQTSSSRVLIFPLELSNRAIPTLADVQEWLRSNNLEEMTDKQFYEATSKLEASSLSPVLVEKSQDVPWFPYLLAKLIQQKRAILVGAAQSQTLSWLEILWYYTPDFLRLHIEWCTYVWSLRTDHEAVVVALGQVEPPPPPSFFQNLFKKPTQEEVEFRFDVTQGISSHRREELELKPLEWLCRELIHQRPWKGWQIEKQREFLISSLERLSHEPRTKLVTLTAGYPASPKLKEFTNLLNKKNPG